MSNNATIEQRVASLEDAVALLQQDQKELAGAVGRISWIDHMSASITDEEAFEELLRFGREYRESDVPNDADDADQ